MAHAIYGDRPSLPHVLVDLERGLESRLIDIRFCGRVATTRSFRPAYPLDTTRLVYTTERDLTPARVASNHKKRSPPSTSPETRKPDNDELERYPHQTI
jgi:hypothetical protein